MKEDQGIGVRVYVVEDKAITRRAIISSLQKLGLEVVGENDEANLALQEMSVLKPDIAILDINLIGIHNGIWLGHRINEQIKIPFIYLTAYEDKATLSEVMQTKPHGFLIKPFNESSIYTSILIALENFTRETTVPQPDYNKKFEESENKVQSSDHDGPEDSGYVIKDSLFVKERHLLVRLQIRDILWIKSEGKYLEIKLDNKTHVVRGKLSDFLARFSESDFLQVHQRYVVNATKVTAYGGGFVKINTEEIPVSKNHRDNLANRLITL